MICIDFETHGIIGNPIYAPPQPVGVSIKEDDGPSHYYAWAHPTENNCSWEDGRKTLLEGIARHTEWLAHNAAFESEILRKYFSFVPKDPLQVHDTQYLLFLTNPYAFSFGLKPSAERILDIRPDEQDDLKAWILANVPEAKVSNWGAYICLAPGNLVGKYACGDTDRTKLLFNHLYPKILENGMLDPYRREQKLMPILSESSRHGVRVDITNLESDIEIYGQAKKAAEDYIHGRLGDFNIDSDVDLAASLERSDMVTDWVLTPTGKRSTARKNLVGRVRDPELLDYLAYRGVLATLLGTFAGPWLQQTALEDGRLHPQWNQIRGSRGDSGDISGTRTGRMSCKEPNLQNVATEFDRLVVPEAIRTLLRDLGAKHPVMHMRSYLLPDEGTIWLKRDFSAQEMRIMAHYAEGKLFEAFRRESKTDPHEWVSQELKATLNIHLERKPVKIIGFGILFGMGVDKLSLSLGVDSVQGKAFRDAYYALLPEIRELSYDTRNRGKRGQFIRTWGGRIYYREPDPTRDLSYKLLNYLIQGSAADQTKQSIIEWNSVRSHTDTFLAAVHDEINVCAPADDAPGAMRRLRSAMNKDRFDVPFESEGFSGPNWSDIEKYEP